MKTQPLTRTPERVSQNTRFSVFIRKVSRYKNQTLLNLTEDKSIMTLQKRLSDRFPLALSRNLRQVGDSGINQKNR